MDYKTLIITADKSVLQAMRQLSDTACRILLLCDSDTLKGVITDGDIRRFILKGGELEESCERAANLSPRTVKKGETAAAEKIMREVDTTAVPIVGENNMLCGLLSHGYNDVCYGKKVNLPVVVMAGGLGTRLYPYTKILPKPLIPIGDLPIAEHIVNRFQNAGCDKFYFVVNHRKNMIKSYFNETTKYDITYIDEDKPLGTAGGLQLLDGMIDTPFFMTNCDILVEADYENIYAEHKKNENVISVVTAFKHIVIPYGVVELNEGGSIKSFSEKPQINVLTNTGFYIVEPEVIRSLAPDESISMPEIIEKYKEQGRRIGAYPVREDAYMDMGQLEELEDMRRRLQDGASQ